MRLYHVTTRQRLASIDAQGLLVSHADPAARIKGVWACSKSRIAWAVLHTQRKHRTPLEEVVVLEVEVSRSKVRRFKSGLWVSDADIAPARIKARRSGSDYGQSIA